MSSTNPVKVGENLIISCSACENEMIQWIWYYNNGIIEEIIVDRDGSGSSTSYDVSSLGMNGSGSSTSYDVSSVGRDGSGSSTSNEFSSEGMSGINTTYVISPVKESDNGTYECVANINGSLYMNNILLSVKGNFDT